MATKEQYIQLIQKKRWRKLEKTDKGNNEEEKKTMLEACGEADAGNDEVVNLLISYLSKDEGDLQLTAIRSLGKLGSKASQAEVHLQHLLTKIDEKDEERAAAIRDAIVDVRDRDATEMHVDALIDD